MFCPKCGSKLDDSASFCTSCGESTKRKTDTSEEKQPDPVQPSPAPSPKKNLPKIAIAGAAVAAAALGIGAAVLLFSSTPIDAEHFPDQAFRTYVSETADTDKDGKLTQGSERHRIHRPLERDLLELRRAAQQRRHHQLGRHRLLQEPERPGDQRQPHNQP